MEYAELDKEGKVLRVIVIEPEVLATGRWGDPKNWVKREDLPAPKETPVVKAMIANGTLSGNATLG
jgi:hypothetical protein